MGQTPKTSFIPKQTTGGPSISARTRKTFNVLTFVSTIVFLAVLMLSVGAFFYKQHNEGRLESSKKELASLRENFESSGSIDTIRALERKIKIGQYLLEQHVSLSRLFDALELRTQSTASLMNFSYGRDPDGTGHVVLAGTALSFNTVALQERGYSGDRIFGQGSVIFSGINTSEGELVTFNVDGDLNPSEVSYRVLPPPSDEVASSPELELAVPGENNMEVIAPETAYASTTETIAADPAPIAPPADPNVATP